MKNKLTFFLSIISLILISSFIFLSFNGFFVDHNNQLTHNDQKYSQVRIFAKTSEDFQKISQAGLNFDGGIKKPGLYFETWLSRDEIRMLDRSGVPYQITIDDWDTYYNNQPKMSDIEIQKALQESKDLFDVGHSIYGSMGGFLTDTQVVSKLDSMRLQYPTLISAKFSLGTSIEGRNMWCVRVTKNPDAPTGRPQVLLHATIHAREPEGMEAQMYFMYWLFENYGTDPTATYILNNREIYWIPVFNRDGYHYNEVTNPNGGGQWRCNRHITSGNCGPVDLNRNFGIYQFWNSPNNGSSTDPCSGGSGTYRGTLPFSEPETHNVLTFFNAHNFIAGIGAHTYGNDFIKPYAWNDPTGTNYDTVFNALLIDLTSQNHYIWGFPSQTVGYYVRGDADDWYYYDSINTANHCFLMTPESGSSSDGFWPPQSRILPLAQGMLWSYQYICLVAGPYVAPLSSAFNQQSYQPGQSGTFNVILKNKGLATANNVTVKWIPANSYLNIPTQQYNYSSIGFFQRQSTTFSFTVANNAPLNCAIPSTLLVKLDTSTVYSQNVYVYIGNGSITLADSAENGMAKWSDPSGHWTVHSDYYHSPSHSFAYAPYTANSNYSLTLATPINITSYPVCYLSFWNRYDLETSYDFGYVEVSSDNGTTWQTVSSYTGTNTTWTQQTFDITSMANYSTQLLIRFRLYSDQSVQYTGWWVDDIKLTNYCVGNIGITGNNNQLPKTFALEQNYPNPFNPSTDIKFQLPVQENVTIKVYDILGKEIAVLINNERREAGYYDVKFDASNFASGVYFYKIEAGTFIATKKMMLLK